MALQKFQPSNLSRETKPWGREVEDRIKALEQAAARGDAAGLNANKAQNSSIDLVSKNIVDLDAKVQAAISGITINTTQINAGALPGTVTIDASQIISGTIGNPVSAPTVIGTQVYAPNAQFNNIVSSRTATWIQNSDGLVGTATSSRKRKTDIRDVDWGDDKLEAIMEMSLVYYRWIASVELAKFIASLPEGHARYGEIVPVHTEIGFIAEEMHARGLWEFVVYARNRDDSLILKNGEPIPKAIHYANWALALHAVTKRLWTDRKRDRHDIDRLLLAAGLDTEE